MSADPAKKLAHVFLFDAVTINQFYYGVWAQPDDRRVEFNRPEYWVEMARLCERGLLDGIFFADLAAGPESLSQNPRARLTAPDTLRGASSSVGQMALPFGLLASYPRSVRHSPVAHAGFDTGSNTHRDSYDPAGRDGAFFPARAAARAYGRERPLTSDEYYALADEFIEVAYKLWEGSWDDGAVVADKDARTYVAPGTVHSIEHSGELFQVDAANYVDPGPQRLPVLAQASGTARGTAFAAKNAELILVGGPTREYCADNIRGLQQAALDAGRAPGSVKTTALVDVIVGASREEAQEKADLYDSFVTLEGALAFAESQLNPEEHADDVRIADLVEAGVLSEADGVVRYGTQRTIAEIKESFRFLRLPHRAVGTAAEVADEIESWLDDDGLDAINLRQWHCFDTLTDFVELVVPELQRRGRFRTAYEPGQTLRERLFDAGPWVDDAHPAHRYRQAFTAVPN